MIDSCKALNVSFRAHVKTHKVLWSSLLTSQSRYESPMLLLQLPYSMFAWLHVGGDGHRQGSVTEGPNNHGHWLLHFSPISSRPGRA